MRILHILSQRPDLTGSGIYVQAMIRESSARGHRNYLIAAANHSSSIPNLDGCEQVIVPFETGQLDFTIPGMSDVMPYRSSRFSEMTARQLAKYENVFWDSIQLVISYFQPDIIHSHHLWLLSSLIGKNVVSTPIVTSCHGSDLRQFFLCSHLQQRVVEGCRRINQIIVLTQSQREEISSLFSIPRERICVVGAGFDKTHFYFLNNRKPQPLQFLYCGKLSRAKGVPQLLKALQHLEVFNWHLHIVGSGTNPEKKECLRLAEQLGNRVTVHGTLDQPHLAKLLHKTHIFVLPSLFEGLPLVILEALACGCRVVASDLPGCREVKEQVDDDLIRLIELPPLTSIDSLAAADEQIFIRNITQALSLAQQDAASSPAVSPERITKNIACFAWERIYDKIYKRYQELLWPSR